MFVKQVVARLLTGGMTCWRARRGSQINVVKELNWWVGGRVCTVSFEADRVAGLRPNVNPSRRSDMSVSNV
jgi:hypothetical protein